MVILHFSETKISNKRKDHGWRQYTPYRLFIEWRIDKEVSSTVQNWICFNIAVRKLQTSISSQISSQTSISRSLLVKLESRLCFFNIVQPWFIKLSNINMCLSYSSYQCWDHVHSFFFSPWFYLSTCITW
jgi:hypothetical protein